MRIFSLSLSLLCVLFFFGCAHPEKQIPRDIASLQATGGMEGIWFVQGTSSTRGPYNGEIELRKSHDGTFDVVRVVTYINSFFDGLKIQEVWTGKAVATADSLTISYELKQADFITRLGNQKRAASEFSTPLTVNTRFIPSNKGLATQFSDKKSSSYTEWITTRRDLESAPLWMNQGQSLDAKGKNIPGIVRAAINIAKKDIGYDKDPYVKSFKNRPEFKEERPTIIFDPTDFQFYRENKDTIRLVNKITDDISITESVAKRNAYSPSLEDKAKGFDKNTPQNHINDAGILSYALLDDNGNFLRYAADGDSVLWTGMYLASQAMRYKVTKDIEALNNVRRTLKGLFAMMEITGDPKEFARTVMPYREGEAIPDRWKQGRGKYVNFIYMEGGNNDMLRGITHGFLWASQVLPKTDKELWARLETNSKALINLNVVREKSQNKPAALGLAALIAHDKKAREDYDYLYSTLKKKIEMSWDSSFYWRGTADWSGINLSMVGDINDIMIADLLGNTRGRDIMRERLMDSWVTYEPAQRHLLTMAAYAFAYRHGVRGDNYREEFKDDSRFIAAMARMPWGLREIPYPRPNVDVSIDHSLNPDWCLSPIPRLFWKAVNKPEPPVEYFYQGLVSYPIFEMNAFDSNFVWKDSAFVYRANHGKNLELTGVDYLYAYWLARYSGAPNVD